MSRDKAVTMTTKAVNIALSADNRTATYTYYANGSLQKLEYDDGSNEEYTYYNDNLLHTLVNKKAVEIMKVG